MIEKKELIELAKLNALKPWQQEKHYIQTVILAILAEYPLVFKGGTYLWFFHFLPRFSEDLDFTASEALAEDLPEKVSKSLELFGLQNSSKIISDNNTTLSFRLSVKGPLNTSLIDECRVYVEISKREKTEKKPLLLKLEFPAYSLPVKRITGMNLMELSAEKVRAIMTRNKARDVFDLYYLIEKKHVLFNEKLADEKLAFYNKKFTKKEFLEKTKEKKSFFVKELKNLVLDELPKFNKTIQSIKKWMQKPQNQK